MGSASYRMKHRTLGRLAFYCAFLGFASLSIARAQDNRKKPHYVPPPPADLPGHVEYVATQLLHTPLDESAPITSQIEQLVINHLQDWMAKQTTASAPGVPPLDVRVRREMERAFSQLEYPLFGEPKVACESWNGALLTVAGYTLGWSDYDRVNVVALFETREAKTRLAGLDHFVPRTDLRLTFLPAPDSKSFRFLAYGTRLGKSQRRLSAVLYGYDGQTLKPLWDTRDVYDGKLEVDKDTIVIRYLKEDEYVRELAYNRKPPRHVAVYKSSPQGLALESDREIPF